MTKRETSLDDTEREARLSEERALIEAQRALQRLVNASGIRYRDLARRMGVSEARVSHLFGDDPTNLTLRTMARIFHVLGEEVVILAKSEYERALAEARGQTLVLDASWHVPAPDFVVWDQSAIDVGAGENFRGNSSSFVHRWTDETTSRAGQRLSR